MLLAKVPVYRLESSHWNMNKLNLFYLFRVVKLKKKKISPTIDLFGLSVFYLNLIQRLMRKLNNVK